MGTPKPRLTILLLVTALTGQIAAEEVRIPEVKDARLQVTLLSSEPKIVTPIGLAADRQGRLYVVESHTHSRGPQYDGSPSDRIIVFEDTDQDGQLDRSRIFADGLRNALMIALSHDDRMYAVQMKSVIALSDADGDGRCESMKSIVTIDTPSNNHHGVLLALAFDHQNRLYVSLGNIGGSTYKLRGSDGSQISGQGDTGLIVRCSADGSSLERFAHGFWNACDLRFDSSGRLLATDNDPDARGPNRVLHVIQGGDYGYKSRFGGSGLHPYCAWNGELPGTLPMLAAVGEAPVGVLECKTASLPEDFGEDLLVSVWGTNQVVRVRTQPRGASLAGRVEPLIIGDASFRPTGIVATHDGTVYIADWADRRYPVHGQGRIWRLSTKPGVATLQPRLSSLPGRTDPTAAGQVRRDANTAEVFFNELVTGATQSDPFAASAATTLLARPAFEHRLLDLVGDKDPARRLVGLLALRQGRVNVDTARLRQLTHDNDPKVRKMALLWAGETGRKELADEFRQSIAVHTRSADEFETFLATLQLLKPAAGASKGERQPEYPLGMTIDRELARTVLADGQQPLSVRIMAMRYLNRASATELIPLLSQLAQADDIVLAAEAICTLGEAHEPSVARLLVTLAQDSAKATSARCEAIMALVAYEGHSAEGLLSLIHDADARIALTAVRALTPQAHHETFRKDFASAATKAPAAADSQSPLSDQLRFALKLGADDRPSTDEQWHKVLTEGGDPEAGRRVFLDRRVECSKCHRVEGRGGRIGPDLSNVAAAKTRQQIIESILHPSAEKSPDFQGYLVVLNDGRVYKGTQFHFRGEAAEMLLDSGTQLRFALRDAESYRALDESLMPEKLAETMAVSEFRDLVAFLNSLRPGASATSNH